MSRIILDLASQVTVTARQSRHVGTLLLIAGTAACDVSRPVAHPESAETRPISVTMGQQTYQVDAALRGGLLDPTLPAAFVSDNGRAPVTRVPVGWSRGKMGALKRGMRFADGDREVELQPVGPGDAFRLRYKEKGRRRIEVDFAFKPGAAGSMLSSLRAVTFDANGVRRAETRWDLSALIAAGQLSRADAQLLGEAFLRAAANVEEDGECWRHTRSMLFSLGGMALSAATYNPAAFFLSSLKLAADMYDYAACMEER